MEKLSKKTVSVEELPVKVLQFGEGNFMRAFVDWQIQQMNHQNLFNSKVAVVQPINQGLGKLLKGQDNLYTVILEGLLEGEVVEKSEVITVIDSVTNPYESYEDFLKLAENEELEFIVSNTTEAGISFNPDDLLTDKPQNSFPGKLTAFLYRRYEANKKGLTIIPCELIDRNGEKLKKIILKYTQIWQLPEGFVEWFEQENTFCCSLVDRIVPGYPRDSAKELAEKLGYEDQLMVKAEPFMLWVIEGPQSLKEILPLEKAGLNVIVTEDMTPYRERKVHLLNGPHTAMVQIAMLAGLKTVEEVMKDVDYRVFIDDLFTKELMPMLTLPEDELKVYTEQIKERFLNPFVNHQLSDIALNSVSKFKARLLPILLRFIDSKQLVPTHIAASLAALILAYRGDVLTPSDDEAVINKFSKAWGNPEQVVATILQDKEIWDVDLTQLPQLETQVNEFLADIESFGARHVVKNLKGDEN